MESKLGPKLIVFWTTTALFCAVVGFSGVSHFTHAENMVEAMFGLGYPLYFMTIIGLAKMAGVVTVLASGLPRLKEWAYAGITFNLAGASDSHTFSGDGFDHAVRPDGILVLCLASYLLRPDSRRVAVALNFAGDQGDASERARSPQLDS